MGAGSDGVYVAGRRIVYRLGKTTQTVSICTDANLRGDYQTRFRLPVTAAVSVDVLADLPDLDALVDHLLELGGTEEGNGSRVSRLPAPVPAPNGDVWVAEAATKVERAITRLVDEFVEFPYLHRVEHSLHVRLAELVTAELGGERRESLRTGEITQLVHKEWPETVARTTADVDHSRGLFDLVVLAPSQIEQASLDQFRSGRIDPPIAIEVGLNYGLAHLRQDIDKLLNSSVPAPFIVHFSRVKVADRDAIEDRLQAESRVRCAYVHHDPDSGIVRFKHVDATAISERRG